MCDNNFVSATGFNCQHYQELDLCTTDGGYGSAWDSAWGTFADYPDPTTGLDASACEVCGCSDNGNYLFILCFNMYDFLTW